MKYSRKYLLSIKQIKDNLLQKKGDFSPQFGKWCGRNLGRFYANFCRGNKLQISFFF